MAPRTRSQGCPNTPQRSIRHAECSTRKRHFFFRDYDRDCGSKTMDAICAVHNITARCGYNWLKERRELDSPAFHHIRKQSKVLGRKSRVSKATCEMLVSPSRNPVRDQLLEAQID